MPSIRHIAADRLRMPYRRQRYSAERPIQPLNFLRASKEPIGEERHPRSSPPRIGSRTIGHDHQVGALCPTPFGYNIDPADRSAASKPHCAVRKSTSTFAHRQQ